MISIFECWVKLHSSVICTPRLNCNKAFSRKLTLFEIQLSRSCFINFSRSEKYSQKAVTSFTYSFAQDFVSGLKTVPVTFLLSGCMFFENRTLGPSIKDVRRDRGGVGQMRTPADCGRGVKRPLQTSASWYFF